jgi:hypothetical protein
VVEASSIGFLNIQIRQILQEEDKTVREWNDYANRMNDPNRRLGGDRDIVKLNKNRYLE